MSMSDQDWVLDQMACDRYDEDRRERESRRSESIIVALGGQALFDQMARDPNFEDWQESESRPSDSIIEALGGPVLSPRARRVYDAVLHCSWSNRGWKYVTYNQIQTYDRQRRYDTKEISNTTIALALKELVEERMLERTGKSRSVRPTLSYRIPPKLVDRFS